MKNSESGPVFKINYDESYNLISVKNIKEETKWKLSCLCKSNI
ncbi:hypothetical protein SAMN05444274_101111 [Mariniphaga anaerophila]|uniref:Uncharacterized protein n=1 Tax=Mariniphaga anaerophila TaxID=1484053 RepID=A0A1M4SQF0_9BACT|nr:hypothetical protein SAMN05444274_101111 [Mariniphaga anaerophila]